MEIHVRMPQLAEMAEHLWKRSLQKLEGKM